jgi:hypothetical protein
MEQLRNRDRDGPSDPRPYPFLGIHPLPITASAHCPTPANGRGFMPLLRLPALCSEMGYGLARETVVLYSRRFGHGTSQRRGLLLCLIAAAYVPGTIKAR